MPTLDRRASFRAGSIATGFQILRLAPPVRVTALNAMHEAVFCRLLKLVQQRCSRSQVDGR